ncbi:PQQ-binding-like beta-propeller repeat protein [Fodinicola acaciae]|uniref:serine/threonine-protein kinase n=1 Tax=Fodinicola acaciae TaxID=2681555 RepID=UPI0013D19312|nr:PQQ-binding-like beta-propeller repeat protein [Fodinicola acaciae]
MGWQPLTRSDPRTVGGYALLARLGSGGMGAVYLGRSAGGRLVAVKVVHEDLAAAPPFRERFAREVAAARAVSGAYTAPVVDADPAAAAPWLATAYLPGITLQEAVTKHGPLPSVWPLAAGLAEALAAVHRAGVVHRDLTPSNVLLLADGPRVIDFGIARAADGTAVTRTTGFIGSPAFLAPEYVNGQTSGPAGDMFSFGAVLAYAATGRVPFGEGPPHLLLYRVVHERPDLSAVTDLHLRGLLAACLDRDPRARPTPEQILATLGSVARPDGKWLPDAVLSDLAELTRAAEHPPTPADDRVHQSADATARGRRISRRALLAAGAGAAVVALCAGTGTGTYELVEAAQTNRWIFKKGGAIALAGGLLFVATSDSTLYALDAITGTTRWQAGLNSAGTLNVVVAHDIVYVLKQRGVEVFRVSDGQNPWAQSTPATGMATVAGANMYFTDDTGVNAVDATTGEYRWRYAAREVGFITPVVSGSLVVAAGFDGTVYGIDAQSGQALWTFKATGQFSEAGLAADAKRCYFGGGNGPLLAVDLQTGKQAWSAPAGSSSSPLLIGDTIYAGESSGNLLAYDAATGKQRWPFPGQQGTDNSGSEGVPTVIGDTAVFYGAPRQLYAINTKTGVRKWDFDLGDTSLSETPPAVLDGVVYATSDKLLAIDVRTGKQIASRPVGDLPERTLASMDTVYVASLEDVTAVKAVR